jgi:hypothetical protein
MEDLAEQRRRVEKRRDTRVGLVIIVSWMAFVLLGIAGCLILDAVAIHGAGSALVSLMFAVVYLLFSLLPH